MSIFCNASSTFGKKVVLLRVAQKVNFVPLEVFIVSFVSSAHDCSFHDYSFVEVPAFLSCMKHALPSAQNVPHHHSSISSKDAICAGGEKVGGLSRRDAGGVQQAVHRHGRQVTPA